MVTPQSFKRYFGPGQLFHFKLNEHKYFHICFHANLCYVGICNMECHQQIKRSRNENTNMYILLRTHIFSKQTLPSLSTYSRSATLRCIIQQLNNLCLIFEMSIHYIKEHLLLNIFLLYELIECHQNLIPKSQYIRFIHKKVIDNLKSTFITVKTFKIN